MNINLKMRRAFSTLVQEVSDYIDRFGGFDLDLYDITYKSMKNLNELPKLINLSKGIIRYIRANYFPNWNDGGYYFWEHGKIMEEQVKILEPMAKKIANSDEEMDIEEILNTLPTPKVLPDGIDYRKYDDIFEQLKLPSIMFNYIFICENLLRKFIIQVLYNNGYPSIDAIGHRKLSEKIERQKNQETTQSYLPVRGGHDIYYLDLIDLNKIFQHEDLWNKCFKNKLKSQSWIKEKIESLYSIRNRVAHSSGYLTSDELRSIETYCREIIKSIDRYIK